MRPIYNIYGMTRVFVFAISSLLSMALHAQTVPASGLVGYWAGDGNAHDSSVNANDGSFSGNYAPGRVGQAFQVTGAGGYVSIPDISAYSFSDAFSVGLWFYGIPGHSAFLGQDEGGGAQNKWFLDYNYAHPGSFELLAFNTAAIHPYPAPTPPSDAVSIDEAWHQLTMVKSGDAYSFYLDGTAIGGQTVPYLFPDPTAPLTFGYAETGLDYNGLIDEVVLYDRAITTVEIQELAGVVPEPSTALFGAASLAGILIRRARKGRSA